MAKIGIIEDSREDAKTRYGFLNKTSHEIHLVMLDPFPEKRELRTWLIDRGFNPERIYFNLEEIPTHLDLYFCDGLNGKCFTLAEVLDKNRVFINTSDSCLKEAVRERGLKVLDGSAMDVVSRLE